jgi:hypothetical protein
MSPLCLGEFLTCAPHLRVKGRIDLFNAAASLIAELRRNVSPSRVPRPPGELN